MTVDEAIRQIRREAGRLGRTARVLEQIQRAIEPPSAAEVGQMAAGRRPLTAEAHLLGVLQDALRAVENLESDLRYAARKKTLQGLEEEWRKHGRPSEAEMRSIQAALETPRE